MKKLLITSLFLLFLLLVFSRPSLAVNCGDTGTYLECGSLGGCLPGHFCNNTLSSTEPYACSFSLTECPVPPTPCSQSSDQQCQGKNSFSACSTNSLCLPQTINAQNQCTCLPIAIPSTTPTPTNSTPFPIITPTPTIEPLTVNGVPCEGSIYPPNSTCYSQVKQTERVGINLVDSNASFLTYPISCIAPPLINYKQTVVGDDPAPNGQVIFKKVKLSTDISDAELGFLGPNSTNLAKASPDKLAQTYLFNSLFDRPGTTNDNTSRESFRTYWRMLDSLSQVQVKAYYIEKATDHVYYYVDKNSKQRRVVVKELGSALSSSYPCLSKYQGRLSSCWKNSRYLDQYIALGKNNPQLREEYDALLPFDFNNMRGYFSNGSMVSEENIPYLRAILTGLKGYREDISVPYNILLPYLGQVSIPNTVIPGLLDYYTPGWAVTPLSLYPTMNKVEELLNTEYPILKIVAGSLVDSACSAPSSTSPQSSPKTYPNSTPKEFGETIDVPVTSREISSTDNQCFCREDDQYCYYRQCDSYKENYTTCNNRGCDFQEGEKIYELTGSEKGSTITIFNNPYITSLTDLIIGGKQLISNTQDSEIIALINTIADKLIAPVQPSFFAMLLPSFATETEIEKKLIAAPSSNSSAVPVETEASVNISGGSSTIYRENNLAQESMQLLQNCWLIPSDQQSSKKCGVKKPIGECSLSEEPLTDVCNKSSFASYATGQGTPLSSYIPLVPPELSAVYAEAEKITGTSCVILAAIHYREGSNGLCTSLISGRRIGAEEPDSPNPNSEDGSYSTLLETAIAAGNEFQGKLNFARGALGPGATDYQLLTTALSFYNGGGNSNCLSDPPSSNYGQCPPLFRGEDDPYPLNFIDPRHSNMYLRCLRDHDCSSSVPDPRPGVYTVAINYYNSLQ